MKSHLNFTAVEIITKLQRGGAQLTTLEINRHFSNSFLITGKGGELFEEAKQHLNERLIIAPHLYREINFYYDIKALMEIIEILTCLKRHYRNLIVHTNSSKAGILGRLAARLLHLPVVHTVHGWSFNPCQHKLFQWLIIHGERLLAKYTRKIIVVTKEDIGKGLNCKIGEFNQYEVIRAVVPLEQYQNCSGLKIRTELNIQSDNPVIGSVAVFKPQKAPFDFVQAAAEVVKQCPRAEFIIAGGGPMLNPARELAEKLNIRDKIHFLGWRKDIPEVINALDIFILTSLWEGLPQVILQAMMASKPVIANAVDGSKEVVVHGVNGYLVPPGCPHLIAQKIIELINNPSKRNEMGKRGKAGIYPEFSLERMLNKITVVFQDLAY